MTVKNPPKVMCGVCETKPQTRVHRFKKSRYLMALCDSCEPRLCNCPLDQCRATKPPTVCRFVVDPHEKERRT